MSGFSFSRTSDAQMRHFTSQPPPPSYAAAQAAAVHTQGNAHVIAAANRRVTQVAGGGDETVPDLSPLPQSLNRPRLPLDKRNPVLDTLPEDAAIVKFQTIVREDVEITVGRIKLPMPHPSNHAFILRRYDTDAISLTTMYKLAFPGASQEDEAREMEWVRSSFDTRNTNGERDNNHVRLAGMWVSRHLAVHLAPAYNMKALITTLARAVPDPNIEYRKSQRSQMAADEIRQSQNTSQQSQTQASRPSGFALPVPAAGTDAGGAADAADREAKRTRTDAADVTSGPSAGAGAGAEETQTYRLEAQTNVTGPFAHARSVMEAEIAAAKQMVIDLRRELQLQSATGTGSEQATAASGAAVPASNEAARGTRRSRDDAEAEADDAAAAGPSASHEAATRVIRTNRTIENAPTAQRAKTFAFNTFIFGLGVGAAAFIPQLAAQYL